MNAVCLLLWLLGVGSEGQAVDLFLIDFEIEDQFGHKHRDDDWRGEVLLLIGSDKDGSQFDDTWTRAIQNSVTTIADVGSLRIVHVADVKGVPFFLKGTVRGKFPRDSAHPIILDWKGEFANAYDFEENKANILVFDRTGLLQHQLAVTEMDPLKMEELKNVLATLGK